ncbi:hypothetical protein MTBBW1_630009 [Desulfamplus magnetovallimortis]|uniref:SMP-30/Gluconolactonase/LRE-like region domain-containing protein n=1 Tax=Desulfamplus magnetovallimortis TaxID=1246637 RepID=A0A1W1HIT1_9BACT|nr:hypothetical protein [Desulfamplus magnetovallimortis]SLM32315.1 hypothetical protein MTBBW1_630009 [Desulfamplus magnetovallimortis]
MTPPYRKIVPVISLLVLLLVSGCGYQQFKTDLFAAFEHESQVGPAAIAWDGKNLVLGCSNQIQFARDIVTEPFYVFSKDTLLNGGSYTSGRFPGPQRRLMDICGMAWEGECCGEGFLWIADAKNDQILKIKPNREFVLSIKSPVKSPNGIAFDGKSLWLISQYSMKIVQFNPELEAIENVYFSPIKRPSGLTWDCEGYIWVVGMDECRNNEKRCVTSRLLRMDTSNGRFTHEVKLPPMIERPSSVALGDGYFWVGDYNLNRVFKIPFKKRKMKEIDLKPDDFQ